MRLAGLANEGRFHASTQRFDDTAARDLEGYLGEHVLGVLEAAMAEALIAAAFIDDATCDDIVGATGKAGSGALIDAFSLRSPFVRRSSRDRYRVHPLFVAVLRERRPETRDRMVSRARHVACGRTEHAIAAYGGPFVPFSDHEWIRAERERLHVTLCTLLRRAASERYNEGDVVGSLRYLERLHELEPWHEDVVRALSTLRCAVGDRAGAFATFAAFRTRLSSDLGVEPMHATMSHFEALARGESPDPFDCRSFVSMH